MADGSARRAVGPLRRSSWWGGSLRGNGRAGWPRRRRTGQVARNGEKLTNAITLCRLVGCHPIRLAPTGGRTFGLARAYTSGKVSTDREAASRPRGFTV